MKQRARMLPRMILIRVGIVVLLLMGLLAAANAAQITVTVDQLNKMRADAGLKPLSGEMASDIPMLQNECEQGIEDSCTVLNSIVEQFSPSHPQITPDSQVPTTQETPI